MNTDELDHDAYRAWWEREGRGDLSVCPCGVAAEDLVLDGTPVRMSAGHGLCPRHRVDMTGGNREMMAQAIIAGGWSEHDLTPEEEDKARRVAEGRPRFDA